jgi:hypothetical protein
VKHGIETKKNSTEHQFASPGAENEGKNMDALITAADINKENQMSSMHVQKFLVPNDRVERDLYIR